MPFDEVNCVDENLAFLQTLSKNGRNSPRRYPREKLSRPGNSARQKPLRRHLEIRATDRWTAWKASTVIIFGWGRGGGKKKAWPRNQDSRKPLRGSATMVPIDCQRRQARPTDSKKISTNSIFGQLQGNCQTTPRAAHLEPEKRLPGTCKNKQTGWDKLEKYTSAHRSKKNSTEAAIGGCKEPSNPLIRPRRPGHESLRQGHRHAKWVAEEK